MSAADRPGDPVPPVVPGYRLDRLLGRGGSGEVWRARPRAGGTAVAVKVLVAGDTERQAREAALLGALDHPHLVRLHEVVHQPRRGGPARVALVLDLLEGGSLAALLTRRGRLRPGEVVTALAPVAAALACAHDRGVVHGDLSPGNVVFTAEGRPVLTDLGVARVLGEDAAGEVTPAYVDPAVARGAAPGPASDVFGVAAAAFHALTGVPPWNAAGPADTLAVAAEGELPDLVELAPDAPPELLEVVARGLSPDPHDRGSAAALALDLRHACRPEPVRLPVAGVPDADLARTGRGPRTELTHQVPGRHRRPEPREVRPARRTPAARLSGALSSGALSSGAPSSGSLVRRGAAAVGLVALVVGAVWIGLVWSRSGPAAQTAGADAPLGSAASSPAAAPGASSTGPAPPPDAAPSTAPDSPASASPDPGTPTPARPPAPPAPATEPAPPAPATEPALPTPATETAPAAGTDWTAVLTGLYDRRAQALTTGSPAALDEVYAAGSPLLEADLAYLAGLAASGEVLRGFRPAVVEVSLTAGPTADGRATVRLVDEWPAYEVVAATEPDGPARRTEAGRGEVAVAVQLVDTATGWRIESAGRLT
ncbi:serine/threonine protein kinase [Geodermatophilus bullaregiensis]|uniref:serine/threonine-protein kinase n=1 Tax=Geodermatophilus bullaregiensis TaxID=1564160 RepID=UPI00195A89F6|nr:serine/threonine-protein kinase [Geodermatophilus bullaregiensis]MBM7804877.1 serine/threonine protein kinase [Geodermatophilus bullaregiensis]